MDDLIIVQFFPLRGNVGRYARTRKDCKTFNEKFAEEVHAADWEHNSFVMYLRDPEYKCRTQRNIEMACITAMKDFYDMILRNDT
jgi:hypothetical protein